MAIQFGKTSFDLQVQLAVHRSADRIGTLRRLMKEAPPFVEPLGAICSVAYDYGFVEFARAHMPKITRPDEEIQAKLVESGRRVSGSTGKVDLVILQYVAPIRNRGTLYPRNGQGIRINFSNYPHVPAMTNKPFNTGSPVLFAGAVGRIWEPRGNNKYAAFHIRNF